MKKRFTALCALLALSFAAQAQDPDFDFQYIDVSADIMRGTFSQPRLLEGNADIVLYKDIATETGRLRARAQKMEFIWPEAEDAQNPDQMTLTDNVIIEHPRFVAECAKAIWYVGQNRIVMTGNPVIELDQGLNVVGSTVELNMDTGEWSIDSSQARGIDIGAMRGSNTNNTPGLLAPADVTNWPSFLEQLKAQAASEAPTPGRQIVQFVSPRFKQLLPGIQAEALAREDLQKGAIGELNKALAAPGFYNADAWSGIAIDADTQALIDRGSSELSSDELVRMNRRLLELAYPGAIATFTP